MPAFTENVASDASSPSVCSWPPSPAMACSQITARGVMLLNTVIGIGLCFAAYSNDHSKVSFLLSGVLMIILCFVVPILLFRSIKMFKASRPTNEQGYDQLESKGRPLGSRTISTSGLKLTIFVDFTCFVLFLSCFLFEVKDAEDLDRWYEHNTILMSYASVTTLVSLIIHFYLLFTQILQLGSVITTKAKTLQCPHCSHTMQPLPTSSSQMEAGYQKTVPVPGRLIQDYLDDSDDNATVVGMAPGQVTGTCTKTPRASTSSGEAQGRQERGESSSANETGEHEGDRLIEKSE